MKYLFLNKSNFTIKTNMSPAIVTNKSKNNGPDTADSGNNTIKYNKSVSRELTNLTFN